MAHFARIDRRNIVVEVIVAEQDFIDSGAVGHPSDWIQTSYNTRRGVHQLGGTPLRKNFAGPGMIYDIDRDAFYAAKPTGTWVLNEQTCVWERPVAYPGDKDNWFVWDEDQQNWIRTDNAAFAGR
jgi:hypothetical protein